MWKAGIHKRNRHCDGSLRYMGMPQFAYVTRRFDVGSRRFLQVCSWVWGVLVFAGILCSANESQCVTLALRHGALIRHVTRHFASATVDTAYKSVILLASPTGFEPVLPP
jgi:hypothetical protein